MRGKRDPRLVWAGFVVVALVSLEFVSLTWFGVLVPVFALGLVVVQRRRRATGGPWFSGSVDRRDLWAIAALYVGVVALFRVAFTGFGTDRVAGLFLSFAAGLVLGVAGPVVYTVWRRGRTLRDLGIGTHRLAATIPLALAFAAVQFTMTLWGYALPKPVDWVPLLVMSLVVGAFEAVFFRGFVQTRLEASFGTVPGIAVAAALYGAYHVGYGMGASEIVFLVGLGVVYAIAFRLVDNVLILWPLLTPLGAFFNNLEGGDIELPWASIAGFADVAMVMGAVVFFAWRHQRKRDATRPTRDPHALAA